MQRADYKKAEALYKESLAIHRALDDSTGISQVLNALGYIYTDRDYGAARSLFEESLLIARHLGLKRYVASTLVNLASLACDEGNYEEAQSLANESLALHRATGDNESTNVGNCLNLLGQVAYEQGKHDIAHEFFERSIQIARRCDSMKGIEITQRHRGRVYLSTGQNTAARSAFKESLVLAQKSGRTVGLADPHLGMGFIELLEGNCPGARSHFKEAVASYEERTNRTGMVRALLALGDVDVMQSQYRFRFALVRPGPTPSGAFGFQERRRLGPSESGHNGCPETTIGACGTILRSLRCNAGGYQW